MSRVIIIADRVIVWGITILVFLIPVFFLPLTADFYEFNKNVLLIIVSLLLLFAWGLKMVLKGQLDWKKTAFDFPILTVLIAFIISTIFASPNKSEAIFTPGGTGTIIGLTVFYFLLTNNSITLAARRYPLNALTASACLLALISLFQFLGISQKISSADWLRPKTWTPTGGLLPLAIFLAIILLAIIPQVFADWKNLKTKKSFKLYFNTLLSLFLAASLGLTIYQLLTTAKVMLLPYQTSWAIALETFKNYPLWGIGPTGFLEAFTRLRPMSFNFTPLWNVRFQTATNFYFQILTTIGLLGLISFGWLGLRILREFKKGDLFLPLLVSLTLFLFLPINFLWLFTFYVLLAALAINLPTREYTEKSRLTLIILAIPIFIFVSVGCYFTSRVWVADFYFRQSLNALSQNKGTETYNFQIWAINWFPQNDLYHLAYSQTNVALANTISSKKDLSDQDRQQITQLIQQAIREAKIAVTLNRNRAASWENLAQIYRLLINFAQGADQWTVAAYQQAIALDPLNPNLRINLGGIYFGLANYDEAIKFFQQAVDLKPDLANSHYNLAAALREKKDYQRAFAEMEVALNLVDAGSSDWQKAKNELDDLRTKLPASATPSAQPTGPSQLTIPSPMASPLIKPLELPKNAAPPITPGE